MARDEIKNSFIDYFSLVGSNVGIILLSFISVPILVRMLGVSNYGRLNLFFMMCQLAIVLMAKWTSPAIVRFGKEEFIKTNSVNETFWARSIISLPIYAIVIATFFIFRKNLASYVGLEIVDVRIIWLMIVYIGLFWFVDFGHNISKATKRIGLYATMELLERVIFLGLLGLVFLTPIFPGVTVIIIFYLARQLLVAIYFLFKNKSRFFNPFKINRQLVRDMFKYSAPLFIVAASVMVMGWIDIFVIKLFFNAEKVGLYSLSYKLMSYLRMLSTHAATVILPILISLHVSKKDSLIKEYVNRFIPQMSFLWSCLISIVMVAAHFGFNLIFEQSFAPSSQVLLILLLGLSSYILFSLYRPILLVYKMTGRIFTINVIALIVNVLLDFMLVPTFGINGAAVATALAIATMVFLQFKATSDYLKVFNIRQFLPLSIACLTFFLLTVLEKTFLTGMVSISAIVLFSWILLKTTKIFKKDDINLLEKLNMPYGLKRFIGRMVTVLS